MQHTLVAVFDNNTDARNAMDELLAAGFPRQDVRMSGDSSAGISGSATSTTTTTSATTSDADTGIGSSIRHFFSDLFGSDEEETRRMSRYEGAVSGGKCVITLSADSLPEVERAADIVERFGPVDIDEHSDQVVAMASSGAMLQGSQSRMQSYSASAQSGTTQQQGSMAGASLQRDTAMEAGRAHATRSDATRSDATRSDATRSIPVVEEQLKVGKREVQRGGVRIFSRVVETPVDESVTLREEHVDVQRRAVDQPISAADADAFKEQSIEMRETAEEAFVQKSARVVEEVTVGKHVNQRQEQIHDTVRHTEVEVERLGGMDNDRDYRDHFQTNFASSGAAYDDYAPAYTYGSQMRSRYAGRQWDEVENDLRTDWDTRSRGGASTWEKMKAAVRHGWDRMTDDDSTNRRY
ncbi:YsnF/AvaK domain-containing protein [Massilia sp. MS-15]|uniref:YsnF/AvaK domain-containing protein n=1 Tax=Massilia sp. MS-15 TaxID=2878200 RepID=UPI001CD5B0FF|nr:YsnF/AvaK domain-containing protein [Massilia sp. MS-15]MCA1246534.1 YsnF/AvaK domain-containing protein [Massilia sp. MS-15]